MISSVFAWTESMCWAEFFWAWRTYPISCIFLFWNTVVSCAQKTQWNLPMYVPCSQ